MDDATGTVPDALFSQEEDTRGYFLLMEGLIRQCGIPLAVYSDRHAVFKHTGEPRQKPAGPTQFARAMEELGIRQIFARSPQAKGRVERTAGTFQDRLVTELRLAGVTTIDEANAVLHRFPVALQREVRGSGRALKRCLPPYGVIDVPGSDTLLQAPPQGGQGQHRQVQLAYLSNYLKMARRHCRRNHRSAHASCNTPR